MIWLVAGAIGFVAAAWAANKAKKAAKGYRVQKPIVKRESVGATAAVEDKEKKVKK